MAQQLSSKGRSQLGEDLMKTLASLPVLPYGTQDLSLGVPFRFLSLTFNRNAPTTSPSAWRVSKHLRFGVWLLCAAVV